MNNSNEINLKILQWNIDTPFYKQRKENLALFPYSLFHKNRIRFIENTIKKLNPDVLSLQEYLPNEINLDDYPYSTSIPLEHYPYLYTVIYSKYPIASVYKDKEGAFVIGEIKNINISSIHLHYNDSEHRSSQIDRLLNQKIDINCLLTGDFNMHKILNKFIHKNDFSSYQKIISSLNYLPKNIFLGSYIIPIELDYTYHSKNLTQINSKTYYDFYKTIQSALDHFPTLIEINKEI